MFDLTFWLGADAQRIANDWLARAAQNELLQQLADARPMVMDANGKLHYKTLT